MDVHLRDLRYFVAVAEELSFTAAAERLYLSQPALSKQIRGLESSLRTRLFDRDRRTVQLTAAGLALLNEARSLLGCWDDAQVVVADAAASDARLLRIGTLTSIGRGLYRGVIDHFAKLQPGWRVELRSFGWGDPTAGLADRVSDAAFLWLPIDGPDIALRVLASESRFVALSSGHPLATRQAIRFSELMAESFVALPQSAGSSSSFWLAVEERGGREPRIAAEVTSADETFEVVSSGSGVVLLAAGNAIIYARPGIVCVPVEDLGPAQLAVAWRRGDRRNAVSDFVKSCAEALTDSRRVPTVASETG
jgi:DNA-binding transcriptional LysR family regulator